MEFKHLVITLLFCIGALQLVEVRGDFCDDFPSRTSLPDGVIFSEHLTYTDASQKSEWPRSTDNPHDLVEGNCTDVGDEYFRIDSCWNNLEGGILTITFRVEPIPNFPNETVVIYCVTMLDRAEDGTGGYPFIIDGGPGYGFVEAGMNSQVDQGLKYSVTIYERIEYIEE